MLSAFLLEDLKRFARYLVVKRLCNDPRYVVARMHFAEGLSKSDVVRLLGISRSVVDSVVRVVKMYVGAVRLVKLSSVVERIFCAVDGVRPIIEVVGGEAVCTLCSYAVRDPEKHVKKLHRDLIEALVSEVLRRALSQQS